MFFQRQLESLGLFEYHINDTVCQTVRVLRAKRQVRHCARRGEDVDGPVCEHSGIVRREEDGKLEHEVGPAGERGFRARPFIGERGLSALDEVRGQHGDGGLRAAELAGSAYVEQVAFMERVIFGDDPDDGI